MLHNSERTGLAERRRSIAEAIRRRLVAHIAAGGTTDLAPGILEGDPASYTDPTRAELERSKLFLELPLVAGLSGDIPAPGDCLLFENIGPSIVIVRGKDGLARGFLNMCTHRASKLVRTNHDGRCDSRARITCPFHAWTFDLDGTLADIPGRPGFEGLDMTQRHLVSVPVAEWNGILFVQAAAGSWPLDVASHLGGFAEELMQLELAEAVPIGSSGLTADCNWKLALDTYGEGYHFARLHAATIGLSHYSNIAVFDEFAPHWRLNFPDKSIGALVGMPESDWPEVEYGGVHFMFPNTVLVVGSSGGGRTFLRMFRLFPGSTPGTMSCRIGVYETGRASDRCAARAEFGRDDAESEVTKEDYGVAVDAYSNLVSAPPGFKVVYGRNEPALQSFHRHVARVIGVSL
jgi:nitrite reductase/ring-hydroxylating ferredoxin subunit